MMSTDIQPDRATTSPPSWPRRREPRPWVAPIDPERPAEITGSIQVDECAACAAGKHVWSAPVRESRKLPWGRVTLVRSRCTCTQCVRCGGRQVRVVVG